MKRAFTLLEILVVIIIIGIIASMTFVSLNGTRAKSRDTKRISDIRQIQSALEMYRNDHNTYPQYLTPGNALIGASNGQTYMRSIPTAPGKNDGSCSSDSYSYTPDNSNTSYHLTYCLGGAVQSAGPSSCEAVPGNICNVASEGEEQTVPGAPTITNVTAGIRYNDISFNAPVSNGGLPITSYRLYGYKDSNSESFLSDLFWEDYILTDGINGGICGGSTFYYRVTAVNALGEGPYSNQMSVINNTPCM